MIDDRMASDLVATPSPSSPFDPVYIMTTLRGLADSDATNNAGTNYTNITGNSSQMEEWRNGTVRRVNSEQHNTKISLFLLSAYIESLVNCPRNFTFVTANPRQNQVRNTRQNQNILLCQIFMTSSHCYGTE